MLTCFLHHVTVDIVAVVAAGVIVEVDIILHTTTVAVIRSVLVCTATGAVNGWIRNKIACSPRRRGRLLKR